MVEFSLISEINPWWKDEREILKDPKVVEALSKTRQYKMSFFKKHGYYSLRGPRQVGKTTFLKLFIKHLIDKGTDPKSVMFFSCDALNNKQEIIDVITIYNDWAKSLGISGRKFILLDEVTFVEKWYEAIKFIIDNGLVDGTLIFTGSLASDIKRGVERFPGREIKQLFYMPMSFREYVTTFGSRVLKSMLKTKIDITSFGQMKTFCSNLLPYLSEINRMLENYLITGRFFRPSYEYYDKGFIGQETYEIYLNWILGDLSKLEKSEQTFKQVISSLIKKYGSPLSTVSIAKETDIGSHKTVGEYLESINDMLLVNVLPKIDIHREETVFKKEKKYYFTDPFLFSVFSGYTRGRYASYVTEDNKSFLLEGVLLDYLRRTQSKNYIKMESVWFYKDRRGEIDFIIRGKNGFMPIELKWQNKIDTRDFKHKDLFDRVLILSKKTFSKEKNMLIMPISVFLLGCEI